MDSFLLFVTVVFFIEINIGYSTRNTDPDKARTTGLIIVLVALAMLVFPDKKQKYTDANG